MPQIIRVRWQLVISPPNPSCLKWHGWIRPSLDNFPGPLFPFYAIAHIGPWIILLDFLSILGLFFVPPWPEAMKLPLEEQGSNMEQSNKPGHKDLEKEVRQTFREKQIVRNGWYFQILINVSWPNFLMAERFLVLLQKAMFEPGQVQWTYLVICHLSILTEKRNAQLWNERNIMNGHWFGRSKQMFQVFCHYKVKIKSSKYILIVPKVLDIRGLHSCLFASKRTNKNDGELLPVQWSQVNFLL